MILTDWFSVKRTLASAAFFILLALVLQSLIDRFWPASYWFRVDLISVEDAPFGVVPRMVVDRTINRSFTGNFSAEVEIKSLNHSGYKLICVGKGEDIRYGVDNVLGDDLDLDWWLNGACQSPLGRKVINIATLPVGKYRVDTCWKIFPDNFFSPRTTCKASNEFRIY